MTVAELQQLARQRASATHRAFILFAHVGRRIAFECSLRRLERRQQGEPRSIYVVAWRRSSTPARTHAAHSHEVSGQLQNHEHREDSQGSCAQD